MNILPRIVRQCLAPAYLGMDRNRFDLEVRPTLTEIPIGKRGIAFDRQELDAWADAYIADRGRPGRNRKGENACEPEPKASSTSTTGSALRTSSTAGNASSSGSATSPRTKPRRGSEDRQAAIDTRQADELREGADELFAAGAGKYLKELEATGGVRSIDTISGHVLLLNEWIGELPFRSICNDSFAEFKADRLAGRKRDGSKTRKVKASTVNRSLEVARTVLNRAARVWRTSDGRPWLGAAPLIEMLDEKLTKRQPYPITWAEQAKLMPSLPDHLGRMVLFMLNTGARDENVCGLRWSWEVPVPELGRSVFVVPASEFKSKRAHVLILNDVAWRIVEQCRGMHEEFVFVYRRERVVHLDREPIMKYRRVDTVNNTAFQTARDEAGLSMMRVHDLRHTFGQRLRDAGVASEDRALLMGHAIEGMPQHYASATVARLVEAANKVATTIDRTTLLRVVNG